MVYSSWGLTGKRLFLKSLKGQWESASYVFQRRDTRYMGLKGRRFLIHSFVLFLTLCAASVSPQALESWGHQIPGVSAAVNPLVGSTLGAGKLVGDKVRPGEHGAVRFSPSPKSTHTPARVPSCPLFLGTAAPGPNG